MTTLDLQQICIRGVSSVFWSYLGSRGLFGRLLVRSLLSVPPDGRSGPDPGLTRLIKKHKTTEQTSHFRTLSDNEQTKQLVIILTHVQYQSKDFIQVNGKLLILTKHYIRKTFYKALQYTTTTHYNLTNKHKVDYHVSDNVNKNRKCMSFVKVELMAELLY